MLVHFSPELEAGLVEFAAQQRRYVDELVQQVVARYFDEESRFVGAVSQGEIGFEPKGFNRVSYPKKK